MFRSARSSSLSDPCRDVVSYCTGYTVIVCAIIFHSVPFVSCRCAFGPLADWHCTLSAGGIGHWHCALLFHFHICFFSEKSFLLFVRNFYAGECGMITVEKKQYSTVLRVLPLGHSIDSRPASLWDSSRGGLALIRRVRASRLDLSRRVFGLDDLWSHVMRWVTRCAPSPAAA